MSVSTACTECNNPCDKPDACGVVGHVVALKGIERSEVEDMRYMCQACYSKQRSPAISIMSDKVDKP